MLPIVLDRYEIKGAGPRGGSSFRFGKWLDRWRGTDVRVLIAHDASHAIVIPAGVELTKDPRTLLFWLPEELRPNVEEAPEGAPPTAMR